MDNIANFLFEVGMLSRTPRSGYQFLGSGTESVAEHILRTVFVGYTLCKMDDSLDESRVLKMCILHDLPEARTGDMNYVNKKYVDVDEDKAVKELTEGLVFWRRYPVSDRRVQCERDKGIIDCPGCGSDCSYITIKRMR